MTVAAISILKMAIRRSNSDDLIDVYGSDALRLFLGVGQSSQKMGVASIHCDHKPYLRVALAHAIVLMKS